VLAAVVRRQAFHHELLHRREALDRNAVDDERDVVGPQRLPGVPVLVVERDRVAREEVADLLAGEQELEGAHQS
jgi:hypothetical protein